MALTIGAKTKSQSFDDSGQVIEVAISYAGTYSVGGDAATIAAIIGTGFTGSFLDGEVVASDESVLLTPRFNTAGTKLMLYNGSSQLGATSVANYVGKLRFIRY